MEPDSVNKLLAIIIPCYNITKKFNVLEGLKQINDPRIEVILINDRSTDGTYDLLKNLKNELSIDVTLISGAFYGPGAARNVGIRKAKAKYVWLVDADDRIFPSSVIKNLSRLETEKLDVLSFKSRNLCPGKDGLVLSSNFDTPDKFGKLQNSRLCGDIICRDIIIKNNLEYPKNVFMSEDSVFTLKLAFFINKHKTVDAVIYEYLYNEDSLSHGEIKPFLSTWFAAKDIVDFTNTKIKNDNERSAWLKFAVRRSIVTTWVRYKRDGENWELLRLMPKMIAASRQMGILKHFQPFYDESFSWKTKLVKKVIVSFCNPISYLISDGLKSIKKEYETPVS